MKIMETGKIIMTHIAAIAEEKMTLKRKKPAFNLSLHEMAYCM